MRRKRSFGIRTHTQKPANTHTTYVPVSERKTKPTPETLNKNNNKKLQKSAYSIRARTRFHSKLPTTVYIIGIHPLAHSQTFAINSLCLL